MSAKRLLDFVVPILQRNDRLETYVDVGANVGLTTLPLIPFFKQIISFEPNPNAVTMFKKNVSSNIVSLKECGLSNMNGSLILREPNGRSDHSTVSEIRKIKWSKNNKNTYNDFKVDVFTLDSFNLQDLDLIKIDTEQHENEVIDGAFETIKRCRPYIFMENKRDEAISAVVKLEDYGYTYKKIGADYFLWRA